MEGNVDKRIVVAHRFFLRDHGYDEAHAGRHIMGGVDEHQRMERSGTDFGY